MAKSRVEQRLIGGGYADDDPAVVLLSRILAMERETGRDLRLDDIPGDCRDRVVRWADLHVEQNDDVGRVLKNTCTRILTR